MPKHPSTQADNIKLRFSVFIVKVTRQGMDEPKTVSLIVELSINPKRFMSIQCASICFFGLEICVYMFHIGLNLGFLLHFVIFDVSPIF